MSLIRTRHTWVFIVLGLGSFAAIWACIFVASKTHVPEGIPKWLAFAPWAAYLAGAVWLGRLYERTWKTTEGTVRADEHGIYVNGRLTLTRRALRHGHPMKDGDRTFLRLHRRAPFAAPYDIEVEDEAEARRLLAALRFDAQTSVSEFELRWGAGKSVQVMRWIKAATGTFAFIAPLFAMRRLGETLAISLWFASCLLISYFLSGNVVQVAVGADGLTLRRTWSRPRFVPYADIEDVRAEGDALYLTLADGSVVPLRTSNTEEGTTVEQRVREALSLYRARNVNAAAAVNRGGRTTSEWLAATKDRRATYREAMVPDEELWNIIEDAAASPTERAGAALSLRTELDEPGRNRLRIAAGACAEKKLRVALESVARNTDDDELVGVLEPLEDRRVKKLSRS